MLTLVWFKRDLRTHDNPALATAAAQGDVLPVYIAEPDLWAQPDASGRQLAFLGECLEDLARDLAALGQPLILRVGDAVEVLERLRLKHGFDQILSHEETGNGWTFARDRPVAAWARAQGIKWVELPQSGVVRRLSSRDGWQTRRDAFVSAPQAARPVALNKVAEGTGAMPGARSLGLAADACAARQRGGRDAALQAMDTFLAARGRSYRWAMSSPVTAERGCGRLSPYLAFGAVSVREVVQATEAARLERRGDKDWGASLRSFSARLAWRDHFMQKLEDEPALEHRALHRAMEGVRPTVPDVGRLDAWEKGETGLPFVDACMRYLNATGWLNFRMRAMLMSVASYHLWLDWRVTGLHLARQFTDFEPGIHWSQVQMQSGTTGINTLRIYNPVKQGLDQDPKGAFIRRWVPELAPVPDTFIHEPWRWPDARLRLASRYPEPVIDPTSAAREARDRVWSLRKAQGFAPEAKRVAQKHGSRKGPVRSVVVRRAQPSSPQLSLDL